MVVTSSCPEIIDGHAARKVKISTKVRGEEAKLSPTLKADSGVQIMCHFGPK
jgi:hypothetical protein